MTKNKLPQLPSLLARKIYKTGQTRGADDDVIYQNRVSRNSTVLIPYGEWRQIQPHIHEINFENGYIVLIPPTIQHFHQALQGDLVIGQNSLYFYETRQDWNTYNPDERHWHVATSRQAPLGGEYVARVPATTAQQGGRKINRGFTETRSKGAGIRFYEYANSSTIIDCRLQLEAIFWHCYDAMDIIQLAGMTEENALCRKQAIIQQCEERGLLDYPRLIQARILNNQHLTICPLCLTLLSARGFLERLPQMEGREVPDLTITQVSLFHIEELRPGRFNHRPYNLGWGHHHCNVVVKDAGIMPTLVWLKSIVERNINAGVTIPDHPQN